MNQSPPVFPEYKFEPTAVAVPISASPLPCQSQQDLSLPSAPFHSLTSPFVYLLICSSRLLLLPLSLLPSPLPSRRFLYVAMLAANIRLNNVLYDF